MDITNLVGSLGFPIVMCWFLVTKGMTILTEITKALNNMTATITELKIAIVDISNRIDVVEKSGGKTIE